MINNKYFIVPISEITQGMLDQVVGSFSGIRKSLDGTLGILKGTDAGEIPSSLENYTAYTHEEILIELSKPEWVSPDLI